MVRQLPHRDAVDLMAQQTVEKKGHVGTQACRILTRETAGLDQSREPRRGSRRLDPVFQRHRTISTSGLVARSLRSMASLSGPSLAISCPNKSTLLVRSCCSQEICARNGRLSRATAVTCRRKAGASSGEPEIARKSKKISVNMIS